MDAASAAFAGHYDETMRGDLAPGQDLPSSFPDHIQVALRKIKEDYDSIFSHRAKVATELGAPATLGRILDAFVPAVRSLAAAGVFDKSTPSFIERRCLTLGWKEDYLRANAAKGEAWWLARLMDLVSGMTDSYAKQVSREIDGT